MSNFLGYVAAETKRDIFFLEDDKMLDLLNKFFAENCWFIVVTYGSTVVEILFYHDTKGKIQAFH